MGAYILGGLLIYLLLSIGMVSWAINHAREHDKSPWQWGGGAALVMYLLVFWDHIPTVIAHKYYCTTEAGFWVYKTVDQWKVENPGVLEGLVDNSPNERYPSWPTEDWRGKKITSINQRLGMLYKNHLSSSEEGELFLHVWRWKNELVDKKTSDVLARNVDFSTGSGFVGGPPRQIKFWLQKDHCNESNEHAEKFGEFLKQIRGKKQ